MLLDRYQAWNWNLVRAARIAQPSGREDGTGVTSSLESSWIPGPVRFRVHGLSAPRRQQDLLPESIHMEDCLARPNRPSNVRANDFDHQYGKWRGDVAVGTAKVGWGSPRRLHWLAVGDPFLVRPSPSRNWGWRKRKMGRDVTACVVVHRIAKATAPTVQVSTSR